MHVPTRTCVGCRTRRPQPDLLRLARRSDGAVVLSGRRLRGRSAYLCPDEACLDRAIKRRAFGRAFRGQAVVGLAPNTSDAASRHWSEWMASLEGEVERLARDGGIDAVHPGTRLHTLTRILEECRGPGALDGRSGVEHEHDVAAQLEVSQDGRIRSSEGSA